MVDYESMGKKPTVDRAVATTRALESLFELAGDDQFFASLNAMLTERYGTVEIKVRAPRRRR